MTLAEQLLTLGLAGWRLWREGDRLRFRAPRAVAGEDTLGFLREHKADILALLAAQPELGDCAPLSHGQRALWFLWLLAPHSAAYNQSMPLVLRGGADAGVWRAACRELVRRHEILRARFVERDGEPYQVFAAAGDGPPWVEHDACGLDGTALRAALEAAHAQPFDLAGESPLRCAWFARDAGEAVLLLTFHHIVCDAWSLEVMRRELARLAAALAGGEALPELSAQPYRDFVHWQRALLDGPEGARLLDFWRAWLTPPPPPLNLPADRPRPPLAGYRGANVALAVPETLAAALRDLANEAEATLNVVLLGVWCVLLERLSGQARFVVGVPSAGRSLAEFAQTVGYFVDPVATPVTVDEEASFRELLAQLRETSRQTLAHRDYPFMLLVEKLNLPRDPSRSPLFDVTFNFLSRREGAAGSAPDTLNIAQADGKFDLTLTVIDEGGPMAVSLGYNLGLFEPASAERFAAQWLELAGELAGAAGQPLRNIARRAAAPILPVLRGAPLATVPAEVHRDILRWCELIPAAPALVCGEETLSWSELGERVAGLAADLHEAGLERGETVGVCLPRCADFVVALLAVLAAGGAYLPLDPGHPPALRGAMLGRGQARLAVAHEGAEFADWAGRKIIPGRRESLPARLAESGKLAYVIFTSGSTGTPKGVAISHAALANYCASMRGDLELTDGASGMVISALHADLGNTLLFPVLIGGGTLHLATDEVVGNPAAFAGYFQRHAVDYLKIVPSHLAALLHGRAPTLPRRALILGGEGSSCAWLAGIVAQATCRVFNHYGPTETTVGVLTHPASAADLAQRTMLPLSRAVAGSDIYLLDERLRPVSAGAVGELAIAGPGLAEGYVGDAPLSAAAFSVLEGVGRVYRSGDLARLGADGSLEILGRADRQIKLHGQRIEPGQVEALLAADPAVAHCAVLPDADGAAAGCLIAAIAPRGEIAPGELEARLRARLAERLPAYLLPSRWVFCATLPVTANGKLDVAALRRLAAEDAQAALGLPRDTVELRLARLWGDVLGHPVGIDEDFFRAGGHSLLAVRLMGRIADEFGVRLPLAALLTHPTVAALAASLRDSAAAGGGPLVTLRRGAGGMPLVLLPGAGGNLLYFNALLAHLPADLPVWGLQALGIGEGEDAPLAVEELAARYVEVLLAQPGSENDVHLAGHSFGGLVAFEMARQLLAQGRRVGLLAVLDNPAPEDDDPLHYAEWSEEDWLRHIALRIGKLYGVTVSLEDGGEPAQRLFRALLDARLLPADTRYEFFHRYVGVYRANVIAAATYRPKGEPMKHSLTLFNAVQADTALGRHGAAGGARGWQAHVGGTLRTVAVPGSHLTMLLEPNAAILGSELRSALGGAA